MAESKTIKLKTDTEHLLFKYLSEEKAIREHLELLVNDLKGQIESLRKQLQEVQEQKIASAENCPETQASSANVQYETDEEELARETEWVRQKSRKKRKLNSSLSPQANIESHKKDPQEKQKVKKTPLPPPIIVENVTNYQQFYDLLSANLTKDSFILKMMNGESVKINAYNDDSYRATTKLLSRNGCLWHSYENKQDRPIRVVAKNLHSSYLPERIVQDLASHGYKIQGAVNKLSWKTKEPLNIFMLSFDKDEDINKIYNIKSILGCKVDIQPLKTSKLIPQCKRCQAYGHTQKYCSKEPRCVKCTGKHLTRDCQKPAEAKPKCVHCGEPHPASYRGCVVAKELQNLKNKNLKKNVSSATSSISTINKKSSANSTVNKNVTYAQKTKEGKSAPQPQTKLVTSNTEEMFTKILSLLTSFDERLKKLESSTNIATHKRKP